MNFRDVFSFAGLLFFSLIKKMKTATNQFMLLNITFPVPGTEVPGMKSV